MSQTKIEDTEEYAAWAAATLETNLKLAKLQLYTARVASGQPLVVPSLADMLPTMDQLTKEFTAANIVQDRANVALARKRDELEKEPPAASGYGKSLLERWENTSRHKHVEGNVTFSIYGTLTQTVAQEEHKAAIHRAAMELGRAINEAVGFELGLRISVQQGQFPRERHGEEG